MTPQLGATYTPTRPGSRAKARTIWRRYGSYYCLSVGEAPDVYWTERQLDAWVRKHDAKVLEQQA